MNNKILILGDVHGSRKPITKLIQQNNLDKNDTIILLGDAGFNFFFDEKDEIFKEKINNCNVNIFAIRGNHEERPSNCIKKDPNKWHTEIFWGNEVYVENDYPNIKYALDFPAIYSIPVLNKEIKTLVLPGAYSVDKYFRLQNDRRWFEDEQLTTEEMKIGNDLVRENSFDLILSHTCPISFEPTDLFLAAIDQTMVDKTMERWMGRLEHECDYKLWAFGHFHCLRVYPKVNDKELIMLYKNVALAIDEYFNDKDIYSCLIYI